MSKKTIAIWLLAVAILANVFVILQNQIKYSFWLVDWDRVDQIKARVLGLGHEVQDTSVPVPVDLHQPAPDHAAEDESEAKAPPDDKDATVELLEGRGDQYIHDESKKRKALEVSAYGQSSIAVFVNHLGIDLNDVTEAPGYSNETNFSYGRIISRRQLTIDGVVYPKGTQFELFMDGPLLATLPEGSMNVFGETTWVKAVGFKNWKTRELRIERGSVYRGKSLPAGTTLFVDKNGDPEEAYRWTGCPQNDQGKNQKGESLKYASNQWTTVSYCNGSQDYFETSCVEAIIEPKQRQFMSGVPARAYAPAVDGLAPHGYLLLDSLSTRKCRQKACTQWLDTGDVLPMQT